LHIHLPLRDVAFFACIFILFVIFIFIVITRLLDEIRFVVFLVKNQRTGDTGEDVGSGSGSGLATASVHEGVSSGINDSTGDVEWNEDKDACSGSGSDSNGGDIKSAGSGETDMDGINGSAGDLDVIEGMVASLDLGRCSITEGAGMYRDSNGSDGEGEGCLSGAVIDPTFKSTECDTIL
jgi:hypothetical protein